MIIDEYKCDMNDNDVLVLKLKITITDMKNDLDFMCYSL